MKGRYNSNGFKKILGYDAFYPGKDSLGIEPVPENLFKRVFRKYFRGNNNKSRGDGGEEEIKIGPVSRERMKNLIKEESKNINNFY